MRSLIGALLLAGLTAACDAPGDTQKPPAPQGEATAAPPSAPATKAGKIDRSNVGATAPSSPFEAKGGKSLTLANFRSKPILLNLWATWCAPCIAEMPALDRLAVREAGNLAVLTVAQDLEGWKPVDAFWSKRGFKALAPYLDQPNALPIALGAKGLPMSVLYDADGKELWRVNGPLEWDQPEVAALLPKAPALANDPWAEAKARGIDFRAVGNEPGWYLEIDSGKALTAVADYGERNFASAKAPRVARAATASFSVADKGRALAVAVRTETCNDGMSDNIYPLAVTMTLDGQEYGGCGRYL